MADNFYASYPFSAAGIAKYATFSAFPASAADGALALALDTDNLYAFSTGSNTWVQIGGPGAALSLGNLDAQSPTAKGAALVAGVLSMQSADATHPGLVNNAAQTLSGNKTFQGNIFTSTDNTYDIGAVGTRFHDGWFSDSVMVGSTTLATRSFAQTFVTGSMGALKLGYDGQWSQIAFDGFNLFGVDANGYSTFLFKNSATPLYEFFGAANTPISTLNSTGLTLTGTITASNFSGSSSGTNTGDVTIGTANGLSLVGQALSLALSSTSTTGALSSTDWDTFNGKQAALTLTNLTDAGTDGITITNGTGAVIGASPVTISQHVADATHNGYLSSTDWSTFNAKQAAGNYITALTGDATASGPGSAALTLATVNSNVGSFGSSTSIPSFTVNAKGLITAAGGSVVIAPAGTLTGTTLASNVVTSSLTAVGTIATGTWNGTVVDVSHGGTGLATLTANNVILGNGASAPNFVAPGSSGNVLTSNGTTWTSASASAPTGVIAQNLLINGAFDLWQRNTTGTAPNGTKAIVADRWWAVNSLGAAGVITCSQQTGAVDGSLFGAQVKVTTAPTVGISTYSYALFQFLDNQSSIQYYNKAVSGSVYVKALGNVTSVKVRTIYNTTQASTYGNYLDTGTTTTVNSSTFTLCSDINAAVSTTPTTAGVIGFTIEAAGVSSGNISDLNNGFIVEQAMFNSGATAATFSRAGSNAAIELSMAQRFYEKSYDLATVPGTVTTTGALQTNINPAPTTAPQNVTIMFHVTKVITPAVVFYNDVTGGTGTWRDGGAGTNPAITPTLGACTNSVSAQVGSMGGLEYAHGHFTADAEF